METEAQRQNCVIIKLAHLDLRAKKKQKQNQKPMNAVVLRCETHVCIQVWSADLERQGTQISTPWTPASCQTRARSYVFAKPIDNKVFILPLHRWGNRPENVKSSLDELQLPTS